jgi:hypothetical protein
VATRAGSFSASDQEHGAFGLVDGLAAVAAVALTLGILTSVAGRSSAFHYGSRQVEQRIAAANAIVDLQAVGAYDRSAYASLAASSGTAVAGLPLPSLTPFPGASTAALQTAPPFRINTQQYDATSGRLLGAIDMPAASGEPALHVPVALVQATSGSADCPQQLRGVAGTAC